jgi:hypothetical protein
MYYKSGTHVTPDLLQKRYLHYHLLSEVGSEAYGSKTGKKHRQCGRNDTAMSVAFLCYSLPSMANDHVAGQNTS